MKPRARKVASPPLYALIALAGEGVPGELAVSVNPLIDTFT